MLCLSVCLRAGVRAYVCVCQSLRKYIKQARISDVWNKEKHLSISYKTACAARCAPIEVSDLPNQYAKGALDPWLPTQLASFINL